MSGWKFPIGTTFWCKWVSILAMIASFTGAYTTLLFQEFTHLKFMSLKLFVISVDGWYHCLQW